MKKELLLLILIIVFVFFSCTQTKKIDTEEEYFHWINNSKNNLFVSKSIDGVLFTVKYLPPEYLAYKELKGLKYSRTMRDSLIKLYSNSRSFLLTFGPELNKDEKDQKGDLLYKGISSIDEYNTRILDLNFNLKDFIQLKSDSNLYLPVLHTFENSYGISPQKNIYLVFSANKRKNNDLLKSESLDFVFDDQIFVSGILHFIFKKDDLDNIPQINFWESN